jgi:hypothetical protein
MSFNPVEDASKSNAELDALLNDVQNLLHAFNLVKTENTQLKAKIGEQDKLMEIAHGRLISILKRLPSAV